MLSFCRKRAALTHPESIVEDFSFSKKPRLDPIPTIAFSSLSEDVSVEVPHQDALDFSFGELTQEFVSTPVPGNEILTNGLESFFSDTPVNALMLKQTSQKPSDEEKKADKPSSDKIPFTTLRPGSPSSAISSDCEQKPAPVKQFSNIDTESFQKRQADRAARNRESSRRAREKAKNRFRALETDNMALRDMVQRLRMHNEHLITQLDRVTIMQQSCTMCRYNAAMAQQPGCRDTTLRP